MRISSISMSQWQKSNPLLLIVLAGAISLSSFNSSGAAGGAEPPASAYADQGIAATDSGQTNIARSIHAGGSVTCAVTASNDAYCWGQNPNGQLGNGTTANALTPVPVAGLQSNTTTLMTTGAHSCAVTLTNAAVCWGTNTWGQLGDGTTTNRSVTTTVSGLTSGVTGLSAGDNHTCALVLSGVKCWGNNYQGQLGSGIPGGTSYVPLDVIGFTGPVHGLTSGDYHNCVITAANGAICWGYNLRGQLGDGSTTDRSMPVPVFGLSNGVSSISAGTSSSGGSHTCAVVNGGAKCWGSNQFGQLGDGSTTDRLIPTDVLGLTQNVIAISAGWNHTCAVMSTGMALCWGRNTYGALGDGSTIDRTSPVPVTGLTTGVVALSAGGYHTCALLLGGTVKCWGGNGGGELGDGTTTSRNTPVDVIGFAGLVGGTISGHVTDNQGAPVTDVTLNLGNGRTTLTDATGAYTFTNVITGTYTITPTKANTGFTPVSLTRSVPPSRTTVDFKASEWGAQPTPFLDLPVPYTGTVEFHQILQNWSADGRVNSWFDHKYPDSGSNDGTGLWLFTNPLTDTTKAYWSGKLRCFDQHCYDGHDGIDIKGQTGLEIRAGFVGTVAAIKAMCPEKEPVWCDGGFGKFVVLYHQVSNTNGYFSLYGHLSAVDVVTGTQVSTGQRIGAMGSTGNSGGPHLHFGVYRDDGDGIWEGGRLDRPVDPYGYRGAQPDP